jgi:hypothetical protein
MQYESLPHYLHGPAFNTPEIQAAEENVLKRWLSLHELPEKKILFHYTTINGLKGILENRTLWLGHAACFKDASEIKYGRNLLINIVQNTIHRESRKDIQDLLQNIILHAEAFTSNSIHHPFICCFCESSNLLSQWREYAGRGGGYCLGFEFTSATRIASSLENKGDEKRPFLRKVIYDEKLQRELIQKYLEDVINATKRALDTSNHNMTIDPIHRCSVMAVQAVNLFLDMLACFKHPAFASEEEWRLIWVTAEFFKPENLRFREENGELYPYRPLYLYEGENSAELKFPLRSIGYGPMLDVDRTRATIHLLHRYRCADKHPIKIEPSISVIASGINLRREPTE